MHLFRARLTEHPHQGALGVAAHNRIINHDQAFARHHRLERVQLEPNTQLADSLRWLDEGAPHIGVLHQAIAEGDAGLLRVTDRGGHTGLGGGHHQVSLDRVLTRQLPPHLNTGLIH